MFLLMSQTKVITGMSQTTQNQITHINKASYLTREKVVRALLSIQQGQSLSIGLDEVLNSVSKDDRGFVHSLLLTTLRHWFATARLLDSLADKPIEEIPVRTTLQLGITQLLYLDVADHASIYETVEVLKYIGLQRATGLVNAILRKVAKNPNKYRKKCSKNHSLPNWLAKQIKQDWGNNYDVLVQALRYPAPMFLRINQQQTDVDSYQQLLATNRIATTALVLNSGFDEQQKFHVKLLRLNGSVRVQLLPNFTTGMVSVQDAHAQLAGKIVYELCNKLKQDKIQRHFLDACTAPGGKLAHFMEQYQADNVQTKSLSEQTDLQDHTHLQEQSQLNADKFHVKQNLTANLSAVTLQPLTSNPTLPSSSSAINITAIDHDKNRLERVQQTLERCQITLPVQTLCVDAANWRYQEKNELSKTEGEQIFDVILLDAPCTATGVIRRHPDIGILRKQTDVQQTVQLQKDILSNLWQQLKVGGYLLYVTCSILKAENEQQIQTFLDVQQNAKEIKLQADWGMAQSVGRQCLPIDAEGGDGFYYALLQKVG